MGCCRSISLAFEGRDSAMAKHLNCLQFAQDHFGEWHILNIWHSKANRDCRSQWVRSAKSHRLSWNEFLKSTNNPTIRALKHPISRSVNMLLVPELGSFRQTNKASFSDNGVSAGIPLPGPLNLQLPAALDRAPAVVPTGPRQLGKKQHLRTCSPTQPS